jgi:hypothetical protein
VKGRISPEIDRLEVADLIPLWGKQNRKARDNGEGRAMLPGFIPTACTQRTLLRTREIWQVQAELVRSNELTR